MKPASLFEKVKGATEKYFRRRNRRPRGIGPDDVRVRFKRAADRRFDLVIGADGLHSGVRRLAFGAQETFERRLGYGVAAFEVGGHRPRDDDVYVVYGEPGRMLARVALRDDRTLFLFVFAADAAAWPGARDLAGQKAMLRDRYGAAQWESRRALDELDRAQDLYFDRVSQIWMKRWSKDRVALVGDAAFCPSLMAGQGSALAMTAAYVLAGELARAGGRRAEAFVRYEKVLRPFFAQKQQGRSALRLRLRAEDALRALSAQFRDQGVRDPGRGEPCVRPGHRRRHAAARLRLCRPACAVTLTPTSPASCSTAGQSRRRRFHQTKATRASASASARAASGRRGPPAPRRSARGRRPAPENRPRGR